MPSINFNQKHFLFLQMSKFSPQKSPNKSGGVQWWQQCARSFVTPYGHADEAPEPSKIFKRLQPFTCEWLTRLDVALSEYSDTIELSRPGGTRQKSAGQIVC